MRGSSRRTCWRLTASLCLIAALAACGGGDDDSAGASEDSATEAASSGASLPTFTSDEIEAALTSADLASDCSAYGNENPGDTDEWGTLDGVRNCSMPNGGSLTWRAYESATDFDPFWCAMRDQLAESGIEPDEVGIVGLNGDNFRVDAVSGTPITFDTGLEGREPLAREVWEEMQAALDGGELVQLGTLAC